MTTSQEIADEVAKARLAYGQLMASMKKLRHLGCKPILPQDCNRSSHASGWAEELPAVIRINTEVY